MKKRYLGVAMISLLSLNCAAADPLAAAFKNGTIRGDINLFYKGVNNRLATDSRYGTGFLRMNYETAPWRGVQAGLALHHGTEVSEKHPGDADEGSGTLLTEAYLSYQGDGYGGKLGRQEIDLEWISDFHQALTLTSDGLPNTELTAGYSHSFAVADEDELQNSFTDISGDGAYFLDARITPIAGLTLNPYYIHEDQTYAGLGLKADYEHPSGLGLTVHYATSEVEITDEPDGDILHLELRGTLGKLALKTGYIRTDTQGGVGHLDDLGENINPLEDGNQVYVADAQTWYLGAEYRVGPASLGVLVGKSDYAGSSDEREINLNLAYDLSQIAENLSLNLLYADIDANSSRDDYKKLTLMMSYGF